MNPDRPEPVLAYGRYRLFESIGRGRITEAFKAKSFGVEGFEKILVIKRVHPELGRDPEFLEAFVELARLAVRLSHTNVAQVFDLGRVALESGTSYFMATEYVAGAPLGWLAAQAARRGAPLPVPACVYVAAEIAKALDHAHRRCDERLQPLGTTHGNLNLNNVLLSWEGEVKVSDFCIAQSLARAASRPATGAMSLEVDRDLQALASLLHELLTGGAREPLATLRPDAPVALVELIERRRQRSPAAHGTAAEFHEALMTCAYASSGMPDAPELSELLEDYRARADRAAAEAFPRPPVLPQPALADSIPPRAPVARHESALRRARNATPAGSAPSWPKLAGERAVSLLVLEFNDADVGLASARARARELLLRYGARIMTDEGFELSALFGLERADGRDTENAVRCGLLLLRCLGGMQVQVSVGVEAGVVPFTSSAQASVEPRDERLLGRARRLARMCPGRLIISAGSAGNLRGLFELQVESGEGDGSYSVGEAHALADVFGPFVGRKAELTRLGELFARASSRKLSVIGVVGEPGVGKTRLLVETEARLAQRAFDVGFYMAACPPRGRQTPRGALRSMLRALCGVHEGDPPEQLRAIEPRLRALGLTADEIDCILAELAAFPTRRSAGEEALCAALGRMVQSLSEDRLQVFAWDNAQEVDAESARILSVMSSRLPQARAVLLFAARPGDVAHFSGIPGYLALELGNLDEADAEKLVAGRLETEHVPQALRDFLSANAQGHPLFIEELLYQALESSAIAVGVDGVRVLGLDGSLAIPRPLRSLLAERVHAVPERERRLLVAATVLGSPADTAIAAALAGMPIGEVNALVEDFERRGLMRRTGPVELSFPSPLLPEVIASGLDADALSDLHARAVRAYEQVLGANLAEHTHRVAEHLALAGERGRAAELFAELGSKLSERSRAR